MPIAQMSPSVTNPTIADIYQQIQSGRLILAPEFQRKFVWTQEHQEEFLDTIINGYPFPEIYVCQGDIDVVALRTTQKVIDGQQRLTTIKRYIDGISDRPYTKVPEFKNLGDKVATFLSYQIVVRDIGKVEETVVREIFRRINLTKFKLEDVEIHNAVYDGAYIKTAKNLLDVVGLKKYGVFHESEFTRMADLHFILLLMTTVEVGGYFPEDKEIENLIAENNEEYANSKKMYDLIVKTFSKIEGLGLPEDSLWFRKSNFFTLAAEFALYIDKIPADIADRLEKLEEQILQNKKNQANEYGKYYQYMYQGTNQRKARLIRSGLFRKEVLGLG